jgi:hypothetical protein
VHALEHVAELIVSVDIIVTDVLTAKPSEHLFHCQGRDKEFSLIRIKHHSVRDGRGEVRAVHVLGIKRGLL